MTNFNVHGFGSYIVGETLDEAVIDGLQGQGPLMRHMIGLQPGVRLYRVHLAYSPSILGGAGGVIVVMDYSIESCLHGPNSKKRAIEWIYAGPKDCVEPHDLPIRGIAKPQEVVQASDLGLPPGEFPPVITFRGENFERRTLGAEECEYESATTRLNVFND